MHFKNKKNALLVFVFLFTFVLAMNWITRKGAIQRDKLLLFPLLHSKLFSRDNCSICDWICTCISLCVCSCICAIHVRKARHFAGSSRFFAVPALRARDNCRPKSRFHSICRRLNKQTFAKMANGKQFAEQTEICKKQNFENENCLKLQRNWAKLGRWALNILSSHLENEWAFVSSIMQANHCSGKINYFKKFRPFSNVCESD